MATRSAAGAGAGAGVAGAGSGGGAWSLRRDHPEVHRALWFATGGMAACSACVFTNPFDVIKTRMQVVGELAGSNQPRPPEYRNSFRAARTIARADGLWALQKGLPVAIGYQAVMNGTRLGTFAPVKALYARATGMPRDSPAVLLNVAAGATSGAVGAFIGSPLYLVKVRLQTQDKAALDVRAPPPAAPTAQTARAGSGAGSTRPAVVTVGYQHKYTSPVQALVSIARTGGVRGLWQGVSSAVPRVMVGSATQLTAYEGVKRWLIGADRGGATFTGDAFATHLCASLLSGVGVTATMNPFDVVSTRLYNQAAAAGERAYSGYADCFVKTAKAEGLRGFYKGVTAQYLRLGPHTVLTFVFWEQLKRVVGAPAPAAP